VVEHVQVKKHKIPHSTPNPLLYEHFMFISHMYIPIMQCSSQTPTFQFQCLVSVNTLQILWSAVKWTLKITPSDQYPYWHSYHTHICLTSVTHRCMHTWLLNIFLSHLCVLFVWLYIISAHAHTVVLTTINTAICAIEHAKTYKDQYVFMHSNNEVYCNILIYRV